MRFIHRTGPPVTVSNRPEPPTHRQPKTRLVGLGRSPVRYEHSRLLDHRNGFTVRYEAGGEVVGILTLNADEDYRRADRILRKHTPMTS